MELHATTSVTAAQRKSAALMAMRGSGGVGEPTWADLSTVAGMLLSWRLEKALMVFLHSDIRASRQDGWLTREELIKPCDQRRCARVEGSLTLPSDLTPASQPDLGRMNQTTAPAQNRSQKWSMGFDAPWKHHCSRRNLFRCSTVSIRLERSIGS